MNLKMTEIQQIFGTLLTVRTLPEQLAQIIDLEDGEVISVIGLPNSQLDIDFTIPIEKLPNGHWTIGKFPYGEIVSYDPIARTVYMDGEEYFLAASVKNLLLQICELENFWKSTVLLAPLGAYRDHHKEYAQMLEERLLAIDPQLLEKDSHYYWGSMLEAIEFGIVG